MRQSQFRAISVEGLEGRNAPSSYASGLILGTDQDDILLGSNQEDLIFAAAGADLILSGRGADFVAAGDGDDVVDAGRGADVVFGEQGEDVIFGGAGRDALFGGEDADLINGGRGADLIHGGSGSDTLIGGRGKDLFLVDGDPFDGADVSAPGRQIIGNEDFLGDFNLRQDAVALDAADFGIEGPLSFVNDLAENLSSSGANVIVLQDSDNDNDPTTPFLAGTAANLIAEQVDESGPGFFVYFNSNLQVNRLVYSTDLSDNTADLKIVNRVTNSTGEDAISDLARYGEDNFVFV